MSKCQFLWENSNVIPNGTLSPCRISNLAIIKELIKLRWLSIGLISQWTLDFYGGGGGIFMWWIKFMEEEEEGKDSKEWHLV